MAITNNVDMTQINGLISQISAEKSELQSQIQKVNKDYSDDGLFNASADGSQIGITDLSMAQVQEMSYDEIVELLSTATDAEIKADLDAEEEKVAEYLEAFDKIQTDIEKLEKQLETLQTQLETLQKEYKDETAKLNRYEAEKTLAENDVEAAQQAYDDAKARKAYEISTSEMQAYDEAVVEYALQTAAAEEEDNETKKDDSDDKAEGSEKKTDISSRKKDKISFSEILRQKRNAKGISSSFDAAIADAASTLADKKAESKRIDKLITKQNLVIEEKATEIRNKETTITNKNTEITNKSNELAPISAKIQETQANIDELKQTMAIRDFINTNEEAILDVAYTKDPEVKAAQAKIDSASDAINGKDGEQGYLQIAANAETAAAEAAKNGDVETAQAKKAEAEEAKRQAEAEKAKADAAKQAIVNKYGERRTAEDAAKADALAEKVTDIQTSVTNATTSLANAIAVSTAQSTISASASVVKDQLEIADAANKAAAQAMAEGDVVTAEAKKAEAEEAKRKAEEAQKAAQEAAAKLEELDANDKKASVIASIDSAVAGYTGYESIEVEGASPLSFDLDGNGVQTTDTIIEFDIDGDGTKDKISDSADAVLVFDKDGDGVSGEDGSECFGNNTDLNNDGKKDGYANGFAALRALAQSAGLINGTDDMVLDANDIQTLENQYGLRIKKDGYNGTASKLSDNGITSINLSTSATSTQNDFDGYKNQLMTQEGATFVQNGATKSYADIWHTSQAKRAENAEKATTREAAGVKFATTTNAAGETVKDYDRLDLTQMLSKKELDLVKKLISEGKVDLTAYDAQNTGYPYFVIAKANDGKYHIYERQFKNGQPTTSLISLARKYGSTQAGQSLKGLDIIANGSGYMNSTKEVEEGATGAKEVYYLTCVNDDLSSCVFGNTFKSYSTGSPLSLDINGDGINTSHNVVDYDIDGDGVMDRINDSADAVLVFDKDGDGVSGKDGSECFGNNTDLDGDGKADGYKDGFEALKALALREGLINNNDDMELDENDIKYLEENFGFKIKANGYNSNAQSLSAFGITTINLARTSETTSHRDFDGMGNHLMTQEGATFVQNGETRDYGDIWHKYIEEDKPNFLGLTMVA